MHAEKKSKEDRLDGLLLVDKPAGITSHDVVALARKSLKVKRVGHTGTLDPMATGLLILCIGQATRLARFLANDDKIYSGTITLGIETDTYDADGRFVAGSSPDSIITSSSPSPSTSSIDSPATSSGSSPATSFAALSQGPAISSQTALPSVEDISQEAILRAIRKLTGRIKQAPPPFSAKKISGERSYKLARKGQTPDLKPVDVLVHYFKVTAFGRDRINFEAKVSAGTYIRSLAHDLGKILGCGAHLSRLKRIACGRFRLSDAQRLSIFEKLTTDGIKKKIIPLSNIPLRLPSASINDRAISLFRHGNPIPESHFLIAEGLSVDDDVLVYSKEGCLLGIGILSKMSLDDGIKVCLQPKIVLH